MSRVTGVEESRRYEWRLRKVRYLGLSTGSDLYLWFRVSPTTERVPVCHSNVVSTLFLSPKDWDSGHEKEGVVFGKEVNDYCNSDRSRESDLFSILDFCRCYMLEGQFTYMVIGLVVHDSGRIVLLPSHVVGIPMGRGRRNDWVVSGRFGDEVRSGVRWTLSPSPFSWTTVGCKVGRYVCRAASLANSSLYTRDTVVGPPLRGICLLYC